MASAPCWLTLGWEALSNEAASSFLTEQNHDKALLLLPWGLSPGVISGQLQDQTLPTPQHGLRRSVGQTSPSLHCIPRALALSQYIS